MATSTSTKTFLTLVVPAALVHLAAGMALLFTSDAAFVVRAADGYPLAALGLCVLLAWRLQRSRLLIAALLTACAAVALESHLFSVHALRSPAIAAALPLGLGLLALTADRPISAPRAYFQLLLAALPAAALLTLLAARPEHVEAVLRHDVLGIGSAAVSQVAVLAGILAILTAGMLAAIRRRPADAGLAWAVLAIVFAFNTGGVHRDVWLLAAGSVLLIALIEAAYVMAFHDELTSLPGRRALNQLLATVRAPYTIAIVDVDRFKSFNDRYGHDVGDQVLRMVATKLGAVGGGGRVFRSGGEEFTIVFPGRSRTEALPHVQALRQAVEQTDFTVRRLPRPKGRNAAAARGSRSAGGRRLGVTISAGLASYSSSMESPQAVIRSADKAMYRAKKNGRNRVVA